MAHPRASQRTRKPTHKASWRFPDNQIPSFGLATDESQTQLHETQQTQLLTPHTGHKRKASQPQPQPQPQGRRRRASSPLTIESGGEEGPGPDEEEPVDEDEVEEEEDEEEEEEETVVISQFAYTSVWTARFEGKKHDTFVKRNNNVTYSIIWHLIDQFLQKEYPQLKRRRFTATAWYPGLTKTSWIVSDCTCFSEVDDLVLEAFEKLFKPQRRTGIHIDVFLTLEKVEEPAAATPAVPSTAPPSTQPRRTPTAQMLAANADARDALGEHGNLSADLKVKWLCGQRDCRNFRTGDEGGYCYWRKSDVAYNHYPISQACFKQWAADIKDDLATVARPSEDAWHLLLQAKIAEANKSYKKRSEPVEASPLGAFGGAFGGGGGMPVMNFLIGYQPPGLPPQYPPSAPRRRSTSPIEPPSSQPTETSPDDRVDAFFEWLRNEKRWKGLDDDVDTIKAALNEHGYDIEGFVSIDTADWREYLLKKGQHVKFKLSVKKWLSERKKRR